MAAEGRGVWQRETLLGLDLTTKQRGTDGDDHYANSRLPQWSFVGESEFVRGEKVRATLYGWVDIRGKTKTMGGRISRLAARKGMHHGICHTVDAAYRSFYSYRWASSAIQDSSSQGRPGLHFLMFLVMRMTIGENFSNSAVK